MLSVEITTQAILALEIVAEATMLGLMVKLNRKSDSFEKRAIARTKELKDHVDLEVAKVLAQVVEVAKGVNALIDAQNALATAPPQLPPPSPGFNGIDPRVAREARTEKEDARALTSAELKGQLGPVVVELWQRFFPDEWSDALKRPHLAMEIFHRLKPQLEKNELVQLREGGTRHKPASYI